MALIKKSKFLSETKGTVLWFDQRDGNGICLTENGFEAYIDISVIPNRLVLNRGQKLEITTRLLNGVKCAVVSRVLS